jgi:hypothetical protein
MAERSDDLYSPSAVVLARQILKYGLRSVITSKLAFDTCKEFNGACAATSKHDSVNSIELPSDIHGSVLALLEDNLSNGEVPFTTGFCKDAEIKKSASSWGLTAHGEWTFTQTRLDEPRSDIIFVRDEKEIPDDDEDTTERTPVALLEVGLTNQNGSTAIDDEWFENFGQGTKYIDLMSNDSVSGQKRKIKETEDRQGRFLDSQGTESEKPQEPSQLFGGN